MSHIDYLHITPADAETHRTGFVEVYREAFGGPPYFESYTPEEVERDVFLPHLAVGFIVMALEEGKSIGLGCAKPMTETENGDQRFVKERFDDGSLPVAPSRLWYMSEMAVLMSHRRRGVGYRLVVERLKLIRAKGISHYCFRTASKQSNSEALYRSLGAVQLPGVLDVSGTAQVENNASQSTTRIFLYGECDEAISAFEKMKK